MDHRGISWGGFGGLSPPDHGAQKKEEKGKERERKEGKKGKQRKKSINMAKRAPFRHKEGRPEGRKLTA